MGLRSVVVLLTVLVTLHLVSGERERSLLHKKRFRTHKEALGDQNPLNPTNALYEKKGKGGGRKSDGGGGDNHSTAGTRSGDGIVVSSPAAPASLGSSGPEGERIDVVYTWVNGSDPHQQDQLEQWKRKVQGIRKQASGKNRFREFDHLRYSIRSLFVFARNFLLNGKIFLVTNGQVPSWLNKDHPRVQIVEHKDMFEHSEALPTFNSNAIEANLHLIKGLSRRFVYFNDDVFLGNRVSASDFFSSGGGQLLYLDKEKKEASAYSKSSDPYYRSLAHCAELLKQKGYDNPFGHRLVAHTPHLFDKEIMASLAQQYASDYNRTSYQKFRSDKDVIVPFMYFHFLSSKKSGGVEVSGHKTKLVEQTLIDKDAKYIDRESSLKKLVETKLSDFPKFINIADPKEDGNDFEKQINKFYHKLAPSPCEVEIGHSQDSKAMELRENSLDASASESANSDQENSSNSTSSEGDGTQNESSGQEGSESAETGGASKHRHNFHNHDGAQQAVNDGRQWLTQS